MKAKKPPFFDEIWDIITAEGCDGEHFWLSAIARKLEGTTALSYFTARDYVRLFRIYAAAGPEEFSGPASHLTRVKNGLYRLDDNPER